VGKKPIFCADNLGRTKKTCLVRLPEKNDAGQFAEVIGVAALDHCPTLSNKPVP
jgi:hypothetical protein